MVQGFTEFFRAEYPDLVRGLFLLTADPAEAEELAQEAMAKVYERWDGVEAMESPGGYLYRTAVNLHRKRVRHLAVRIAKLRLFARDAPGPAATEAHMELAVALGSLSDNLREAFMLVEWFGLTSEEAGEILGIKAPSVRSRVHRARQALREELREDAESHG